MPGTVQGPPHVLRTSPSQRWRGKLRLAHRRYGPVLGFEF